MIIELLKNRFIAIMAFLLVVVAVVGNFATAVGLQIDPTATKEMLALINDKVLAWLDAAAVAIVALLPAWDKLLAALKGESAE